MAVTFKDAEEYRRKKAEENYNNAGGQTGNTGLPSGGVTLQQAEQYRRQHSESYMQQQHAYRTAQHQKKIAIYNRKVQNYVDAVKQNGYLSQYDTYKKAQSRLDELERFGYNNDMRRTYDPSVYDSSVTGFDTPHKEFEALFDRARQLNAYEHAVVDYSNARNPGYLESYRISNAEGEFDYDPEIWAQEQRKFEEAVAQYRYLQGFENRDAMRARAADLKTQYGDREVRSYTDSDGEYPEVWSEKKKAIAEAARPKYQSELFGSWQEEAAALENYADQLDALDAQEEYNKYKEEHPKEAALGEYVYTNKWSGKSFEERILDVKETAAGGRAVTDYPGVYKNNNELAADLLFYALNNATLDELEKANEDINSRAGSFANFQTDYASWAKLISDYYTDRVGKEYSRQYNVAVNQPDWKDKSAWEGSPDDEFGIGHVLNYVNLRNKNYYGERWGNGDSLADDPAGVNSFGELWGDIKWGLDIGDTASLSDNYGYEPDIIERMPRYQFDMASYLYHTQGAAAAKEYLDYIYENLKSGYSNRWAERYDQMRENAGESSARTAEILFPWDNEARLKGYQAGLKASDAFASVGTAAFAPAAGAEGLGSLAEYYLFGKVPGAGETPINDMRQQIREEVQKLNNFSGGERFAYGTVMSIADCLVTMAVGGAISSAAGMGGTAAKGITGLQKWVNECKDLVLPMMSGQAAVPAFREAKKRGLDDKHAMAMSLAATFAEWVTERIGIETFLSDPSNLALYLGKNVLAEGSEEFLSNALNTLADAIVNGGDSEVRQKKRHYMDEYRLGEKEASWRAFVDWLAEAGLDTLGGAISGAFFGGVGIASTFSDDVRVGRSFNAGKNGVGVTAAEGASENDIRIAGEINRDGNAAVFREILDRFGPESEQGAAAQKALYDLKNGKKISDSRMGKLTRFLAEDMVKKGEVENAGDALDLISMHQNASMLSSALDKVPGVTVTVNGEKTKIIGITGERGARSFTTADGTTVKMNGLDARATDPSARMVLVFADNVDNADVGRIAIENYTPDTDANAYTRGLYAIYKAAIGEVSFNEAVAAAGEYASAVPSDAQHAAYKAGLVEAGKNAGSQTKGGTYDVSTSLITQGKDLSEYSPDRQKSIQNYLNAVDEKLLRFVNNAIQETNKKNLENMHRNFGQILSENIYKKAETLLGFDVSDYQISINGEAVRHIKNGHNGLAGSSDNTMSDNRDIARIGYILANADDVDYAYDQNGNRQFDSQYKGKDNKPSAVLAISKKVDGTYVIGTVAADSKAKTLRIKTAYTTQTQKRSGQESLPENGPRLTSETHLASASADIVSQNGQSVKTDNVERSANPSPQSADADSSPSPASRGKELSGNGASEAKTPPKVKLADLLSKKETRRGAADFDASMRKISDPKVKDLTGKMTPGEKAVFGLFADAFGVDITYLAELPDGAFGEIVSYLRSVKISAESPNPISSAIHEVTHLFRAMDRAMGSDIYDGLRDAALHHLENSGADLDELIDRQLELHEGEKDFDTDDAIEEVVANAYGDAVPNARDFADRLIRFAAEDGYSKKKTKTLLEGVKGYFEKLKKFFSDLLAKTRNALGRTAVTREGIYLQNKVDVCDQMLDAFLDAGKKLNEIYRSYVESDETSPAVTGNVKYQKNEHAIKHVLRENGNALINMSPVAEVVSDGINGMRKGIQVQIVLLDLKQYGKYIEREGFGKILIGENEIKEALSYIHDDAGFAAFKALPGVLKRGTIIDTDIDHKNNGFDTVTIAAPVVINGVRGNMGAIIKKTGKLRYKTHAILMPDGSRFVFEKQNAEFAPGKISAENGNAGLPSNSASNDIVSSENGFVKSKRQIGEDQAALEELERELDGEREKVGRLEKKSEKQEAAIRALSHALAVEPDRIPSYKDLKKLTKDLIESYSSTLDAGKLQSRLSVVCERFRRGLDRKGDFASVYAQVSDIAASIVDSAEAVVGDSPAWEEGYDDFLRRMRNGVRLTETQRQEIGSAYDGFEKWRRDHFGRFNVTSDADATALDEIWDELREYVPSMLPASSEISEGDMALRAAELADRLAERKKETYNPFFYDVFEGGEVKPLTDLDADVERGMAIDGVAQEILSGLADVGDIKTARAAESEGYARARDEFAERLGDLRRETLKERNDWRVAMAADKNAAIEEYRQARKLTELRDKTTRLIKKMSRALLEPTKTVYVPRGLYEASIGALEAIDVGANLTTKAGRQLETLRDRLSYLKQEYDALKASGDPDFMTEYDEHFSDRIARLTDAVGDLPIRKMSYEQLNEVYSLLKEVDGLITDARLQIAAGELMENHDLGMTAVAEMEKAAPKFAAWRNYSGLTLNVVRLANMMGGYDPNSVIVKQVGSLVEGVRKRDLYIMQHTKPFEELEAEAKKYGYKSFDDWRSEAIDVGLVDLDGKAVLLTRPQIMQIVMTYKREQASHGKLEHLWKGGIDVPDLARILKGDKTGAMERMQHVDHISGEDVGRMMKHVGEYESRWMELARDFFNGDSYKALNEVWRVLRHTEMPKSPEYIPYRVDKNYVTSDIPGLMYNASLDNAGYLKNTQTRAPQPLIIMGLDVVVDEHIEDVGKQVGLAIPLRNLNKVYNVRDVTSGKSVKETLSKYWKVGSSGDVISQAMADLQTGRQQDYNWASKMLGKLRTGYIQKTLNLNLSVAMSQAASYFAAGAELSQASIQKGLVRLPYVLAHQKALWNEIDAHTAQNWIRRRGLSTVELGDLSKIETFADRLPSWMTGSKWIQAIDVLTTTWLWDTTKLDVNAQIRSGKLEIERGSEEYWQAVTELYDRMIESTQPMYDPLHRPEMLKNTNMLARTMFMFKTQPMQNHGILFDAGGNLAAVYERYKGDKSDAAKTARAEARRRFGRAAWSQINSAVVFRAMKVLCMLLLFKVDPLRDEDKELTPESIWKAAMIDFGSDVTGTIAPLASGLGAYDIIRNAIEGNFKEFGLEVKIPETEMIGNVYNAVGKAIQAISALWKEAEDGEKSDNVFFSMAGPIWDAVKEFAGLNGIPLGQAAGYVNAVRNWATDIKNGEFAKFEAGADRKPGQTYDIMYEAAVSGDKEKASSFEAKARAAGQTWSQIESAMRTRLAEDERIIPFAEAYEAGDWETYDRIYGELYDMFGSDDVIYGARDKYLKSLEPEEEKEDEQSDGDVKPYSDDRLVRAIIDGDEDTVDRIASWYDDAGRDFPKSGVTSKLKEIWNDLPESERNDITGLLIRYGGYDPDTIAKWDDGYRSSSEIAKDSFDYAVKGRSDDAVRVISESMESKYDGYIEDGYSPAEAKKKAASAAKTQLTKIFKPAYVEGDATTRQLIRNALSYYTDLDGGKLYGSYSEITKMLDRWLKE